MSKEKILVINSKDKQSGTNGRFTVQFNDSSCQQVQKVLVKEIFVPNLFYNISNEVGRKNNTLTFSQNGLANITVTVPEGQYTVDNLITTLKGLIDGVLIDGVIVTITKNNITFKLTFTFTGAGTVANNNVQFFVATSTISPVIGLENDTASTNILVMNDIYNLVGSEYVQIHSDQVGEIHGLDAGASGYIDLVDTVSLSNTPVTLLNFSITIYPLVGNSDASVKVTVVAVEVMSPFKVVFSSRAATDTPPTGSLT